MKTSTKNTASKLVWIVPAMTLFAIPIASIAKADELFDCRLRINVLLNQIAMSGFEGRTNAYSTNAYSLLELNKIASDFLSSKDPTFPTNALPWVYIPNIKTNRIVTLGYIQGVGKTYWQVSIGKDGKVNDYRTGIVVH